MQQPSFSDGVDYWNATPATVTGVLGGFGPTTTVPLADETSSRILILDLIPALSAVATPTTIAAEQRSYRALDCGAGVGRVTQNVLLPLCSRIDLVEPVTKFLEKVKEKGDKRTEKGWKLLKELKEGEMGKSVRCWQAGLQFFNPSMPAVALAGGECSHFCTLESSGGVKVAFPEPAEELNRVDGYDIMMLQWCLGHLSNVELVQFLIRCQKALRIDQNGKVVGFIIVKENTCKDDEGPLGEVFDVGDSSITRSDKSFRTIFKAAGLTLLRSEVQKGFPVELFPVISYVLV